MKTLYDRNLWVESFYAPHTLEVDFALANERVNSDYISKIIDLNYVDLNTIKKHKKNLKEGTDAACAETVLMLARDMGKGWYATTLSNYIDVTVSVPQYILKAVAFASREVISIDILFKMVEYSISKHQERDDNDLEMKIKKAITQEEKRDCIKQFRKEYKENVVIKFLKEVDRYCMDWCK